MGYLIFSAQNKFLGVNRKVFEFSPESVLSESPDRSTLLHERSKTQQPSFLGGGGGKIDF